MSLTVISNGFGARTGTAGVVTGGFGTGGANPAPLLARSDGDEKRRRKRERESLEEYRLKQLRLRERLTAAYADVTGEALPAEQIADMANPPREVRAVMRELRRVEKKIYAFDASVLQAIQDEDDMTIILMLLN